MSLGDRVREQVGERVRHALPDPRRRLAAAQFPYRAAPTPDGVEPLPVERGTGAEYDTDWARTFAARWVRVLLLEGVLRPTIAGIARPQRRGVDRLTDLIDEGGPVIFCANHHSHVDTPLILTSLPEPWRHQVFVAAAADYFFRTRATGAAAALALHAIPIDRSTVTRRSADLSASLIDDGWSMVIFPEGGRSPDGWGQDFRRGAAYLAKRTGVPVVPIHLAGTGRILRKGSKRVHPAPTSVTFGAPLRLRDGEETRGFSARIEAAVTALADEHTTDWYQARKRAHAAANPPLTGPDAPSWRRLWALGDRRSAADRRRSSRRWPNR